VPTVVRGLRSVSLPDLTQSNTLYHFERNRYGKRNVAVYELGTPEKADPGKEYGLCWGNGVIVGKLVLQGPWVKDGDVRNCTLGMPCVARLEGIGFSDKNMLLLAPRKTCTPSLLSTIPFKMYTMSY
jgi:hypothetical protein